jgi:hypothetical protein
MPKADTPPKAEKQRREINQPSNEKLSRKKPTSPSVILLFSLSFYNLKPLDNLSRKK